MEDKSNKPGIVKKDPLRIKKKHSSITGPPDSVLKAMLIRYIATIIIVWIAAHYGLTETIISALGTLITGMF